MYGPVLCGVYVGFVWDLCWVYVGLGGHMGVIMVYVVAYVLVYVGVREYMGIMSFYGVYMWLVGYRGLGFCRWFM